MPASTPSRTDAPRPKTAGGWYLIGAGLIVSAVCMTIVAFGSMMNGIEGMQRAVMPGKATIHFPPGISVLYAEQRSKFEDKKYEVDHPFKYRCGVDEPTRKVDFHKATADVHYSIGDYAGSSAWEVNVEADGDYTLVCESDEQFVMAIGRGVGSWIVVAVLGLVPFLLGVVLMLVVFFKRRAQR